MFNMINLPTRVTGVTSPNSTSYYTTSMHISRCACVVVIRAIWICYSSKVGKSKIPNYIFYFYSSKGNDLKFRIMVHVDHGTELLIAIFPFFPPLMSKC